jgi:hypothetical protein
VFGNATAGSIAAVPHVTEEVAAVEATGVGELPNAGDGDAVTGGADVPTIDGDGVPFGTPALPTVVPPAQFDSASAMSKAKPPRNENGRSSRTGGRCKLVAPQIADFRLSPAGAKPLAQRPHQNRNIQCLQ